MIVLDKNGQWGRFFKRWDIKHPNNLCKLFWKCTFFPLGFTVLGAAISVLLFDILILGNYLIFMYLFFDVPFLDPYFVFAILAGVVWAVIAFFSGYELGKYLWNKMPSSDESEAASKFNSGLDVIVEGYRGFKEKVCPLVSWEEQ